MVPAQPGALLRPGLLDGATIVLACAPRGGFAAAVEELCGGLGARVLRFEAAFVGEAQEREAAITADLEALIAGPGEASMLIVDCASLFERSGPGGGLVDSLQVVWELTRALANRAFIPGSAGGRIVLVAPRSADGAGQATAAAAGLENLARTLSIEWARYAITALAVAPGPDTGADQLATLCAYLASPAGSYFSGCLMDLRGPRAAGA